jgi:Haem-binding domain
MKPRWTGQIKFFLIPVTLFVSAASIMQTEPRNPLVDRSRTIESEMRVPPRVESVLQRACHDCHSDETEWPWYAKVWPVAALVEHDVDKGRHAMNLSEWSAQNGKTPAMALSTLVAACADLQQQRMPPPQYRMLHPRSRVTNADVSTFCQWTSTQSARLADIQRQRVSQLTRPLVVSN